MRKIKIALADDIAEGATVKFSFVSGGKNMHGFLARFHGKLVAYENRCRHLPVTLDFGSDRFLESEGNHFVCQSHGALYDPLTGLCVRGPCEGESLKPLRIEVEDDAVWLLESI